MPRGPRVPRDPVIVDRLVAGEKPDHHRLDRVEAVRIMLAAGVPRRVIADRLGISLDAARRACERVLAKQRGSGP